MHSTSLPGITIPKTVDKNLSIIIRVICFFWFIARIKSRKIWMVEDRLYPSIPVFDFLDGFPPVILETLYYVTMLCLLFLVFKPNKTIVQIILFISVFIAAIFEMTAWQPWEYQYLCMIAVIIINSKKPAALYTALILIMASIYFYSGMQKFNGGFLHSVWKGLILKKFFGITDVNLLVHYAGLSLALLEAFAGLALLLLKNKKAPAYMLIGMHFFILVLLPNVVGFSTVLPWNFAMIVILHFLFIKQQTEFKPRYLFNRVNFIIFILWALMPATSSLGYWEQHFSSNLYTGKYKHLSICIPLDKTPESIKRFTVKNIKCCKDNQTLIATSLWTVNEMTVMAPSSEWYGRKFKRKFNKNLNVDSEFFILQYPYTQCVKLN